MVDFKLMALANKYHGTMRILDGANTSIAASTTTTSTYTPRSTDVVMIPLFLILGAPAISSSQQITVRVDNETIVSALSPLNGAVAFTYDFIPLRLARNSIVVIWQNTDSSTASTIAYQIVTVEMPRHEVENFIREMSGVTI